MNFVGNRKIWFIAAIALVVISVLIPVARGGFNFSIEFTGGSQFAVSDVDTTDTSTAVEAVDGVVTGSNARVTAVGEGSIRVQTDQLTADETQQVSRALASAYGVDESEITNSFIGASWGQDITRQALVGLVVFLALAFLTMALYFRTWKMSAAAMIALLDVLVITLGVYAASNFEVSPATVIGFLTILGYSLYDTVVVFDKIRENTTEDSGDSASRTFSESVNLAVNQTLVRSINTSVVAALPVAAILISGFFMPGVETLRDISLSLLVGILVATYSTIFVAAPLYALFREKEPAIAERDARVLAAREKALANS
ncbi:MAG: protein translocase subunit SecF [Mycetocola sp.]